MKTSRYSLIILVLLNLLSEATSYGTSSQRAKGAKYSAPSLEDHASYFSNEKSSSTWKQRDLADKLRVKAIKSIQRMAGQKVNETRKFELYLRLGELLAERSDYIRAKEIHLWGKRHDQWSKYKKGQEPRLTHKNSTNLLKNSAQYFRKIVKEYPGHSRSDAALFSLAKTLARLKDKQATFFFNKLIKEYPKSSLMADTYLALGEWFFDRKDIPRAMVNYKKAIKYKESPAYAYAVYKLGWAYFNDPRGDSFQNHQKSLSAFKLVVRLSDRNRQKRGLNLRKEAINDLVMVWSETEGVEDAWKYFSHLKEYSAFYDVLEKLGNTYADQGKRKKAISSFARLLKEAPERERNPQIYSKLINIYDQLGSHKLVIKGLLSMQSLYASNDSIWIKNNMGDSDLLKESKEKVESLMHRYGTLYHQKGQKTEDSNLLKSAIKIYQSYLSFYSGNKNSYNIRYYLADLYFQFKMYEPASDEYLRVARLDRKGEHFKESAQNAVAAINSLVTGKKWKKLPDLGTVKKPIRIPREKVKFIKVIDAYVDLLPKDKLGFPMRFTAAKVYYEHGHYKEALVRFERIAIQIPNAKEGKVSLKTVLNFHSDREEWPVVIKKSRRLLSVESLSGKEPKGVIIGFLKNAVFKQAVKYEKDKEHLKAAGMFLNYQKEFPKDRDSDKAIFNASINFYKMADVDSALETDKKLLSVYPNSKLVPDVNLNIAHTYEGIADYGQAAEFYALFSTRFAKDKRSPAALFNAATLYRGLKQYELSLKYYHDFVQRYPRHTNISESVYEMAHIYEKIGKHKASIKHYRRYLKLAKKDSVDRKLYVQAKSDKIEYKYVDNIRGKSNLLKLGRKLNSKNGPAAFEARRIVASVLFDEIQGDHRKFMSSQIKSAKSLETDVKKKQRNLLDLAKKYEQVINVGSGEYTVAALYRLGELHEGFSDSLFKAPSPIGANQITVDQYRSSIEKVAFPLKEEAYKYYETSYKKSSQVETFTAWTKKSYMKMADLYPEKHPEIMENSTFPAYMSHKLSWDSSLASLID